MSKVKKLSVVCARTIVSDESARVKRSLECAVNNCERNRLLLARINGERLIMCVHLHRGFFCIRILECVLGAAVAVKNHLSGKTGLNRSFFSSRTSASGLRFKFSRYSFYIYFKCLSCSSPPPYTQSMCLYKYILISSLY